MRTRVTHLRSVAAWTGQLAAWSLLLAASAVLTAAVIVPGLGGATPYAILSGSMRPALEPGDLVVVRPADPDSIGIGQVITYQVEPGRPAVVTHRVVATAIAGGRRVFQTQGDQNNAADTNWIVPEQIRGVLWYRLPHVGHLHDVMSGSQRQWAVQIAAGGLLAYAVSMFAGAARDRRRARRTAPPACSATVDPVAVGNR